MKKESKRISHFKTGGIKKKREKEKDRISKKQLKDYLTNKNNKI